MPTILSSQYVFEITEVICECVLIFKFSRDYRKVELFASCLRLLASGSC